MSRFTPATSWLVSGLISLATAVALLVEPMSALAGGGNPTGF